MTVGVEEKGDDFIDNNAVERRRLVSLILQTVMYGYQTSCHPRSPELR